MESKKKNVNLIIGIVLGILLTSGISVFATSATNHYLATEVIYSKNGNNITVNQALNELYQNKRETSDTTKEITTRGTQTLDKYYKNINVNTQSNLVLAGHGESSFQTTTTTETNVTSTLDNSNILTLSNNIFTTKKAGKYLIVYAVGSDSQSNSAWPDYSAYIKLYINSTSNLLNHWRATYVVNCIIQSLNKGDTIKATCYGNGGASQAADAYKRKALYKVYYLNEN